MPGAAAGVQDMAFGTTTLYLYYEWHDWYTPGIGSGLLSIEKNISSSSSTQYPHADL